MTMNNLPGEGSVKNVILVDDDPDDRELFAEAIELIDSASNLAMKRNGEELMDYLQHTKGAPAPDIIFLDLNMPRMNGTEALQQLKKDERFSDIPVIIYSTSLNPRDIDETYNAGACRFLRKPNSFEELKRSLKEILQANFSDSLLRSKADFIISLNLSKNVE